MDRRAYFSDWKPRTPGDVHKDEQNRKKLYKWLMLNG